MAVEDVVSPLLTDPVSMSRYAVPETTLLDLSPDELAAAPETADIVARFTRADEVNGDGSEAVRVAAFNSFI